ncbi:carboxypeptidase regulatory-like domain-containing protein [Paludibaculum fermentans]|uniref:TonB-dependent receptor n=1 Tax=Paludibaculum fermentans TaxID=1473598 RepID=UPI003EBDE1A3
MLHVRVTRLLIVGLLFAFCLMAQRDLGTIVGTVTDPQGGVIPNAKVTIKEEATGLVYDVTTNSSGEFVRPALKPGNYTVTGEATGFRRVAQQNIILVGGDRVGVPLSLPVGNVSESVEVTAQAPLLQTESTTLGADLGKKVVSELPLGGQRTFAYLARLSPGVLQAENGARDATGGGFSANGVRSNGQNNFLLNGVDNNVNVIDFLNQTAFVVGPSVEAIGEMRVLTNGYNAEYGRGAGGVVNVNLKQGTNELHGVLFEILQNDKINANRWEYNKAGKARGPFKQNQYGAAIGGPIIKNKLFMFGDYQGTRITSSGGSIQSLGYGGFYTIPTAAMKSGNFASILGGSAGTDANGNNILTNQIFDPKSNSTVNGQLIRTPFTGNIIPSSRFDPAAAKIMALYPATNQPIIAGNTPRNDYFVSTAGNQNTDQGDGRVDYRLSDKDSLFGSLSWSNLNKYNEPFLPGALDGTPFSAVTEEDLSRNAQISYTRVWSPSIVSETRVGFSRLVTSRVGANPDKDLYKEFGIGGYNPMTALNGGLPQMQFATGGYTQIGANDWLPSKEYSNVWDFIQNVSILKGHHSYKFGAEFRPIKFPFFQVPYPHGEMNFNRNETAYPSVAGSLNTTTGDDMASFLLGNVNNGRISTNNFISSEKLAWAFFAQDDWKISPKLTINIGLRYELFSPIGEKFARQSNFVYDNLTLYIPKGKDQNAPLPPNFATAFPNVKVSRGEVDKYMIPWDKTNLAPRIGFAYNWKDNTVLRGSYGIFYGGEENQGGNPNRGESVPFNQSTDLARPGASSIFDVNPFFANGFSAGYPINVFSLDAPVSFRGVARNFRSSLVHKWSAAVQREMPWQTSLELAYVGNHQSHQLFQPDWNACPNLGTTAAISCNSLRPTPYIGGISGTASFGFGDYHGMTAKFDKRYSNGLVLMAAYTYGHALANTGTTLSGSTGFGILDPRNYSSSYSTAAWDLRHNFVSNFSYELPFGKGKTYGSNMNKVANAVVGNWQVNGILTLHTGQPFTLNYNGCQGQWNRCMPDLVAGKDPQAAPSGGRNPSKWFDTSAVAKAAPLTGGNLGLQSNTGPATRVLDFSLFKDFRFTERLRMQFRAEGTNVANTPQFSVPDNALQNSTFGQVTATNAGSERHMQFSLRFQF